MNTSYWPKAFDDFAKMAEFSAAHHAASAARWKATRGMKTGCRLFWQMQHEGWFEGEARVAMMPETAEAVTAYAASIGVKIGSPVADKWRERYIGGATIRLTGAGKRPVHHGIMDDADAPEWQLTNEVPDHVEQIFVGFDTAQGWSEDREAGSGIEIKTIWNPWGRP